MWKTILICMCLFGSVCCQSSIVVSPEDATTTAGESVIFRCKATVPPDWPLAWKKRDSSTDIYIYSSLDKQVIDPTKYEIVGDPNRDEFDLLVKNVQLADAGEYVCDVHAKSLASASLVVLDDLYAAVPESKAGDNIVLTCDVKFNGPAILAVDDQKHPKITGTIGTETLATTDAIETPQEAGSAEPWFLKLKFNRTMQIGDDGHNFTCTVSTKMPAFTVETSTPVLVKHKVTNLVISPNPIEEYYTAGDVVICSADGNPEPTISWMALESNAPNSAEDDRLLINNRMIVGENSKNKWKCTAMNNIGDGLETAIKEIIFYVNPSKEENKGEPARSTKDNIGWKIAVGVSVPLFLLLVLAVVLSMFFRKRRKDVRAASKRKTDEESPKDNPNYKKDEDEEDDEEEEDEDEKPPAESQANNYHPPAVSQEEPTTTTEQGLRKDGDLTGSATLLPQSLSEYQAADTAV